MVKKLLAILLLATPLYAEQVAVSSFCGLNNNESSLIIKDCEAQDALNMDLTPGGKSAKKRSGYGLYKNLGITKPIKGMHHFFDSSGNDVIVAGSSTSIYGIVSDGTPTQLVSSATLASTFDCEDVQGNAYCVTSNRDFLVRTNGATMLWQSSVLGTMVTSTPDRLVVAGVAAAPSSLYVSKSNDFVNFTVGNLNSDSFIEPIAAPGSKLTHIRWGCGKLLWWKDQSFGWTIFEDQYTLENRIISDTIGTYDNSSAVDPGGDVYFRGQDGHIWKYDCAGLTKESIEITPFMQASGRRTANFLLYDSQTDFEQGSSSGTSTLSTTISPGSVVISSFTKTENSSASGWGSGTASDLTVGTSSISISVANADITNGSFENGSIDNWTTAGGATNSASITGLNCTITPQAGSKLLEAGSTSSSPTNLFAQLKTCGGTFISSTTYAYANNSCTWTQRTVSGSGYQGKSVKLAFISQSGSSFLTYAISDCFIFSGTDPTFYTASDQTRASPPPQIFGFAVDNVQSGSSTITTGNFTSQSFNLGFPYGNVFTSATWSVSAANPSFVLQKSNNNSTWFEVGTGTGTNFSVNARYVRYKSTFTVVAGLDAPVLTGVQLIARSSGTYFSAVRNATSLSAWSTFNPTYTDNGDDINFFIRSSTSPFYVQNSSPPWTAQTPGALVSASTGTYFQLIASFTVTAATNTPSSLDAFTINWFDGTASDQAYLHYFDNAIWATMAYGTGVSSNTYIFRRDLINDVWSPPYNFGAGGFLTQANRLYFGDVSDNGRLFVFGSGTSDNGSTINAYWRSKSFTSPDPFLEASLTNIDTIVRRDPNQTLTAAYELGGSTTTTSYSISLSDASRDKIHHRKLIPSGKTGYSFSLKYSDDSSASAWELLGYRIGFTANPYRPTPP